MYYVLVPHRGKDEKHRNRFNHIMLHPTPSESDFGCNLFLSLKSNFACRSCPLPCLLPYILALCTGFSARSHALERKLLFSISYRIFHLCPRPVVGGGVSQMATVDTRSFRKDTETPLRGRPQGNDGTLGQGQRFPRLKGRLPC